MNCSDFRPQLVEFLDDRLAPAPAADARAHLESCVDCRREAELHRRSWDLVGRLGSVEPPASFVSSVRRRVRRSRIRTIVGSCAAAAAVVAALLFAMRSPDKPVVVESELAKLPQEDRRLLEELATGRTWELADHMELIRAFELLDGVAPPAEEDH